MSINNNEKTRTLLAVRKIRRQKDVEWSSHNVVQNRLSNCKCTNHTKIRTSTYRSFRGLGVSHVLRIQFLYNPSVNTHPSAPAINMARQHRTE
ncbi:uncharacterized protein LAJ45_00027 [Morchella importuna]|uniref:uncharacterized protein n=1 Tax=Morchella importuna TaxID=1174673 RepID=UPI001E8E6221|nr:uncharacterized protein LAJ45_00027 [Morchella importuna]KAH8155019.1 hypothetical protein LAJ45_00027 [Morchella importuna]